MENSNFKKLSNTLVDYFQRIQNEIDFKSGGLYSKYGRSIKLDLNRNNTLQDLFDALVASGIILSEPTPTSWDFEITDRIQLTGCAFVYLKVEEVAPNANYYRIHAITDGMKVISTSTDLMKTIDYIMSYAESLPNAIPTDSDLVHKAEEETIWGQKTFTAKTTFDAETNFNTNTNFAGTAQFNGNLKIKNKTIETIIDERVESNEAIDTRINNVAAIAEGKTNSYVVEKTQGNNKLDSQNDSVALSSGDFPLTTTGGSKIAYADLKIGDIIYITNTNVPDRWVGLKQNNSVTLYKMETAKVDLANYYTKSEVDALIESKISQYLTSIEADDVEFGS